MNRSISKIWLLWLLISLSASIGLALGLRFQQDSVNQFSQVYLPGETTSGHYQIELKCSACHDAAGKVDEQKCLDCHQAELKQFQDTHPKTKFIDPTRRHLLQKIEATKCVTCHQEHQPERTLAMGLTVPNDFCWHCHADVSKDRPSHAPFDFASCQKAGCHNYHDNTALYENFLEKHSGEPDHFAVQKVLLRESIAIVSGKQLSGQQANAPVEFLVNAQVLHAHAPDAGLIDAGLKDSRINGGGLNEGGLRNSQLLEDWVETAHAQQGVNCRDCHSDSGKNSDGNWQSAVSMERCAQCHQQQAKTFMQGKHGMRLAVGLSPFTPGMARLPLHNDVAHRELNCQSCHQGHRFDTQFAAVQACLQCHDDEHSKAYINSPHALLWQAEITGQAEPGTGVSCATCHLPRIQNEEGKVEVTHNQNWNLQPNEKMIRSVCLNCHGLGLTLDSLASAEILKNCFSSRPQHHVESLDMVQNWFDQKRRKTTPEAINTERSPRSDK